MLAVRAPRGRIHVGLGEIVDDELAAGLQVLWVALQSLFQSLGFLGGEIHTDHELVGKLGRGSRSDSDAEREKRAGKDAHPTVHGLPPHDWCVRIRYPAPIVLVLARRKKGLAEGDATGLRSGAILLSNDSTVASAA